MGKRVEEGEALRSTKIRNSSPRFRRLFFYTGFRGHLHGGSGTYCCYRRRLASNRAGRSEAGGGRRAGGTALRAWTGVGGCIGSIPRPCILPLSPPVHVQHGVL